MDSNETIKLNMFNIYSLNLNSPLYELKQNFSYRNVANMLLGEYLNLPPQTLQYHSQYVSGFLKDAIFDVRDMLGATNEGNIIWKGDTDTSIINPKIYCILSKYTSVYFEHPYVPFRKGLYSERFNSTADSKDVNKRLENFTGAQIASIINTLRTWQIDLKLQTDIETYEQLKTYEAQWLEYKNKLYFNNMDYLFEWVAERQKYART